MSKPPLEVSAHRAFETVHGIQCSTIGCNAVLELHFVADGPHAPLDHREMEEALEAAAGILGWTRYAADEWSCPSAKKAHTP
jgi:hypothetical protein